MADEQQQQQQQQQQQHSAKRKGSEAPTEAPSRVAKRARASEHKPTKGVTKSTNKPLSSRFRGVTWNRKNKRWQASINIGGKYKYLGSFLSEDDAAVAFDRAAVELRGRKARVNFSLDGGCTWARGALGGGFGCCFFGGGVFVL
jgi:hypothetical protein